MRELLPCPKCGSQAELWGDTTCGWMTSWVTCKKCGYRQDYENLDVKGTVSAWNWHTINEKRVVK